MKRLFSLIFVLLIFLVSCSTGEKSSDLKENALMFQSSRPLQAPVFDKIQSSDFAPAIKEAIAEHREEIQKIADNPEAPTFENTLVALEKSGQSLDRILQIFGILTSAHTDSILQETEEELSPLLAAHADELYLNDTLFGKVKKIYEGRKDFDGDKEDLRLIDYYYDQFVKSGANLKEEDKEQLKELNKRAATLSTRFTNRLLRATKEGALAVEDQEALKGFSEADIKKAKETAEDREEKDKWVITLQNTTQQPALQDLENRTTRKELFEASIRRAEKGDSNDTRDLIKELATLRAQRARLLGFADYASWKLQDQMAKEPSTVNQFLNNLIQPSVNKAKEEATEIQKLIEAEGADFELAAYDWNYYAEKIRKKKYDLDENEIKPYLELNTVLEKGVFYAAQELYGLTFKERKDLPVWQEDVRTFDVIDKNDSLLGIFYCDYFKRDNKGGGAWMSNLVTQSKLLDQKPVIYNVCNFKKPASGEPALISFDDVITMFHEFGHALHGFFADQKYPSLSGTSVARDFVEFPSQFNEHWALNDKILKNYALHYETGEPMPKALVEKIKKSSKFNQGYLFTELLAAAILDMKWHTLSAGDEVGEVEDFEKSALTSSAIYLPEVPPRYKSSYFMHIWGNAYAAGYYAYIWTQMLDADAYEWFEKHGGMTRENGERYRKIVLSKGDTEDYAALFRELTGKDPQVEPLLKAKGLE